MKKRQAARCIIVSLSGLLLIAVIWFFRFIGYRITVPYRHSFIEIDDNVYMNRGFSGNRDELITLIGDAEKRNTDFWGELQCDPVIIFCDDERLLSRLGGDHDALRVSFSLLDMDEPSEFYAGTAEDRRFHCIIAKHEVGEWLDIHEKQGLSELLCRLNDGEDFYSAYGC